MSKYSDEFKIKAIQMVLEGNSVKYVCRILGMPDSRPLRDWLAHYNHEGKVKRTQPGRIPDQVLKNSLIMSNFLGAYRQ